jgi:hypothetical protein
MKKILIYFLLPVGILFGCSTPKNADAVNNVSCIPCKNDRITCYKDKFGLFNGSDNSVSVNAADVKVKLNKPIISADGKTLNFIAKITTTNALNNAAWGIQGYILLPDRVFIEEYSSSNSLVNILFQHGGLPLPSGVGDPSIKTGNIYFCKQSMNRCDSFEIKFKIRFSDELNIKDKLPCKFNVGLFAYSQSPDQYLSNNYDYWEYCESAKLNNTCKDSISTKSETTSESTEKNPFERETFRFPLCTNWKPFKKNCSIDIGCGLEGKCINPLNVLKNSLDFLTPQLILIDTENPEKEIGKVEIKDKDQILKVPTEFQNLPKSQKVIVRVFPKNEKAFGKEFIIERHKM